MVLERSQDGSPPRMSDPPFLCAGSFLLQYPASLAKVKRGVPASQTKQRFERLLGKLKRGKGSLGEVTQGRA